MRWVRTITSLCVSACALTGAAEAHAAASYAQGSGNQLGVGEDPNGTPDVVNDITAILTGGNYSFTDPGGIVASGTGTCTEVSPSEVSCPAGGVSFFNGSLAGGNDRLVLPLDTGLTFASLTFGAGDDFFQGGAETDNARGEGGNDRLFLGPGNDQNTLGGPGSDQIYGEAGDDRADGDAAIGNVDSTGAGDDLLDGGDGNDFLDGNQGADTVTGGPGNDSLFDCLSTQCFGGQYTESVHVIDTLSGGDGNDTISAGLGGDLIDGGPGTDVINASGGTALGGDGNDLVSAVGGSFTPPGGQPQFLGDASSLDGGPGDDILQGTTPSFDFPAEQVSDQLTCGEGSDKVIPGQGDVAALDCEFVYELLTCTSATCEGSISVVAPAPAAGAKRAGAKQKLVLADKSFEIRRGQRAKLAKISQSAAKTLLKGRKTAGVTKTVELSSGGANNRKTKRTKTRYKLTK